MKYYLNKTINTNIEIATKRITEELQKEGFGVVTQFDVNKALKDKLEIEFRKYRIMGACNPSFALKSINTEPLIGTILPCNVMLHEKGTETEIAIINPIYMIKDIDNPEMKKIAKDIYDKMIKVIKAV